MAILEFHCCQRMYTRYSCSSCERIHIHTTENFELSEKWMTFKFKNALIFCMWLSLWITLSSSFHWTQYIVTVSHSPMGGGAQRNILHALQEFKKNHVFLYIWRVEICIFLCIRTYPELFKWYIITILKL